jgi:DNA-binding transcriptional regulator YiaG
LGSWKKQNQKVLLKKEGREEIMTVGEKIRSTRKHKLTQSQLAEAIGVHEMTLRRWENGLRVPNADDLQRLATVLNTSVAYLMDETDNMAPPEETQFPAMMNAAIGGDHSVNVTGTVNGLKTAGTARESKNATQNIIIRVGDVHMEFPEHTPVDVIAQVIKSARENIA